MNRDAYHTLQSFGMDDAQLHALPSISNRIWRVHCDQGIFVLRIAAATHTTADRLNCEFAWLQAIHEETELVAPIPQATLRGESFCLTKSSHFASLFRWIPGQTLDQNDMDCETLQEIGTFVARLHEHAAQFQPKPPWKPALMLADHLFSAKSLYHSVDIALERVLPEELRSLIAEVGERFRAHLTPLDGDPSACGMIHGDLVAKNWLRCPTGLALIDFDHSGWGYFWYDLAALCIQFLDEENFAALQAALIDGYASSRPWPANAEHLLENCIIARYAASCLWLARESVQPQFAGKAQAALAFRSEQLKRYLVSGQLPRRGVQF